MKAPISHAAGGVVVVTLEGQDELGATPMDKDEPRAAPVPTSGEPDWMTNSVGAEGVEETKPGLAIKEWLSKSVADCQPPRSYAMLLVTGVELLWNTKRTEHRRPNTNRPPRQAPQSRFSGCLVCR